MNDLTSIENRYSEIFSERKEYEEYGYDFRKSKKMMISGIFLVLHLIFLRKKVLEPFW